MVEGTSSFPKLNFIGDVGWGFLKLCERGAVFFTVIVSITGGFCGDVIGLTGRIPLPCDGYIFWVSSAPTNDGDLNSLTRSPGSAPYSMVSVTISVIFVPPGTAIIELDVCTLLFIPTLKAMRSGKVTWLLLTYSPREWTAMLKSSIFSLL